MLKLPAPTFPRCDPHAQWLGIAGGMLMVFLMARGVSGAFVYGIFFATIISWSVSSFLPLPRPCPVAAVTRWL